MLHSSCLLFFCVSYGGCKRVSCSQCFSSIIGDGRDLLRQFFPRSLVFRVMCVSVCLVRSLMQSEFAATFQSNHSSWLEICNIGLWHSTLSLFSRGYWWQQLAIEGKRSDAGASGVLGLGQTRGQSRTVMRSWCQNTARHLRYKTVRWFLCCSARVLCVCVSVCVPWNIVSSPVMEPHTLKSQGRQHHDKKSALIHTGSHI